jgi:hypothetical protein
MLPIVMVALAYERERTSPTRAAIDLVIMRQLGEVSDL